MGLLPKNLVGDVCVGHFNVFVGWVLVLTIAVYKTRIDVLDLILYFLLCNMPVIVLLYRLAQSHQRRVAVPLMKTACACYLKPYLCFVRR